MTDFWADGEREARAYARSRLVEGHPTGLAENFGAALDAVQAYRQVLSDEMMRYEIMQERLDQVWRATGERLPNPLIPHKEEERGLQRKYVDARIERLREEHPDLPDLSDEGIKADALARQQAALARYRDVAGRAEGVGGAIGIFAGEAAGMLTDPVQLLTAPLGAGRAAGILATAAREAAVAGATQVGVEALTAPIQMRVDPDYGLGEAVENVATAAAAGGALGAAFKAGEKGVAALWRRYAGQRPSVEPPPHVRDAEAVVEREAHIERAIDPDGVTADVAAERRDRFHQIETEAASPPPLTAERPKPFAFPDDRLDDVLPLPSDDPRRVHPAEARRLAATPEAADQIVLNARRLLLDRPDATVETPTGLRRLEEALDEADEDMRAADAIEQLCGLGADTK